MDQKEIALRLTKLQILKLKRHYDQIIGYVEVGLPLKPKVIEQFKTKLSEIVNNAKEWQDALREINIFEKSYCIRLVHEDNEILNLPWEWAVDNLSGKELGDIDGLFISKSFPNFLQNKDFQATSAPLKILIMVSSPLDANFTNRLSYEEEEYEILRAFEPLIYKGLVEVDYTEDGSLEALKHKLMTNKYHILHFSGHAVYREKDKSGFLQLEDPLSMHTEWVEAERFADAICCNSKHTLPIIILASCQTAQGRLGKNVSGVTNHLLQKGIPAIVAMGMSIRDDYATQFSAWFYGLLAEKQSIFTAFKTAWGKRGRCVGMLEC